MNKIRIIYLTIKTLKVLVFAGALFVIVLFLFLPKGEPIQIGGPFWLIENPEMIQNISGVLPKVDQVNFLEFQTDMEVPLTDALAFLISFLIIVVSGYFFYLLHLAQQVVRDIRSGHSFTLVNIKRIKIMGILIASSMFGEKILTRVAEEWFSSNYKFEGLKIISEPQLGWYIVIIGAIIFALGVAFEQGLKLKEEQDLTI